MNKVKRCLLCGRLIETTGNTQKYCKNCAYEMRKRNSNTEHDDYIQTCQQCGHKFTGRKRKYCTVDCRKIANGHKKKPKPEYKSLNEIARLCSEAGMTYGQYVAKYESR